MSTETCYLVNRRTEEPKNRTTGVERSGARDQDPEFVQKAFASIAPRYVVTNHVLSLGIDVLWRRRFAGIVRRLCEGVAKPRILDVATGSGDLAAAVMARNPKADLVASDFCAPMLAVARERGVENLIVADGMNLPFSDETFDVVTIGFGLRNMESWAGAAGEFARVLRPGGSLVVLDFSLPRLGLVRMFYRFYLHVLLPRIAGLMTGEGEAYRYLCGSIERFPSGEKMCELLCANGFAEADAEQLSLGISSIYVARKD